MHYELCIFKLHGEGVEAPVYNGYSAGDERGGVRDEILDGAAELFRFAETLERCLADYVCAALSERTVRICEQRTVLVCEEETGSDGIHTD